jgi:formate-dependent nitrite reductase cytochrome c552 subunit
LKAGLQDAPASVKADPQVFHEWATTAHAKAGVNCSGCHDVEDKASRTKRWSDKLDHTACIQCHTEEVDGFLAGKHGMRLARGLSPMTPAQARLPMKADAAHRELSCTSCHGSHTFDTRRAAVDACISCHDDMHTQAYFKSSHFKLWEAEAGGTAPARSGVSCATCHLPREAHGLGKDAHARVQHNQNANLRPNEKMVRTVCLDCHGLAFSLDALADAALVRTNFIGRPARHVESIDLAVRRQNEILRNKSKTEIKP